MDHPYSFWADVLSKFQGATPWIQALWLVLLAVVAMGAVWCATDFAKHVIAGIRRTRSRARLVYGLVQDADGRWLVCIDGEATPADAFRGGPRSRADLPLAAASRVEILPP